MKKVVCAECRKGYDFEQDEFCPRCGAFNQPVRTWGVDSRGNVVRVDGINEANHAESFVHKEVHREKDIRQKKGMDWKSPKAAPQPQMTTGRKSTFDNWDARKKEKTSPGVWKTIGIIMGLIILLNFVLPLLTLLLDLL